MSSLDKRTLDGKTALVTGAATGIGKAIALDLAAAGAQVVVNHNHTPEPAAAAVKEIEGTGGSGLAIVADVSDRAEYQAMIERLIAEFDHWDILVNNAAGAVTKLSKEYGPARRFHAASSHLPSSARIRKDLP